MKKLSEMTLAELWELFPIILEPHNPEWKQWYAEAEEEILQALGTENIVGIHHIGSTYVETIWAKPTVDILLEVVPERFQLTDKLLSEIGWQRMSISETRISYNKGYTESGFAKKVYHLHLRMPEDNAELSFRDYLVAHPETAREYEALKLSLWKEYEHDRDGYTNAKTEFIQKYSKRFPL